MYHRAAMQLPTLLAERPRPVQVVLAVVVPVVYGAITGIFLGISEAVYRKGVGESPREVPGPLG
jgi:hypothetical protein